MKNLWIRRAQLAAIIGFASAPLVAPAHAKTIGDWQVEATDSFCSEGTNKDGASAIFLTAKTGSNGILIKPADQSTITTGTDYKLQISLNGESDVTSTAGTVSFGGAKVLVLKIPATAIAAGEADGFAMRVKLNDRVLFDKDMHGARDAFAAFVACSKKFKA